MFGFFFKRKSQKRGKGPYFAMPKKVECEKTMKLTGMTKAERIKEILRVAGWSEGRNVDIAAIEELYQKHGALLTEGAKNFYREFYGIAEYWWVKWEFNPAWGADVSFALVPDFDTLLLNEYDRRIEEVFEEDFFDQKELAELTAMAQEAFSYVGDIGYYYPSDIFVGESGKIYKLNSNHIERMQTFASIWEFLEWDLKNLDLAYITALNSEEWKSMG